MTALAVTVYGLPAPQGSKRHVGGGVMVESSKKVKPWRQDVKATVEASLPAGWVPLDGPVTVTATFFLPRPAGHPKTRRTYPIRTPDLDKLVRSTFDALSAAGVWTDDARCVDLTTRKRYAHPERLALFGELLSPGVILTIDGGDRS